MKLLLILDYEIYDEDGPCAPYFTGRITDADGRVMCNAENEERAVELVDHVEALRARLAEVEAQMIEHASTSANATTALIEAKGQLKDAVELLLIAANHAHDSGEEDSFEDEIYLFLAKLEEK